MRPREGKEDKSKCPFCGELLEMPGNIKMETTEFTGGRCRCGAVYVCDPTGHNVGEAYLDALLFASGDDWGLFHRLNLGDNYDEYVFDYDMATHRLSPASDIRAGLSGKMVFVRLRE